MVRGTNRRVIVVKSPDPRVFEEAIFVLKEDFMKQQSAETVLEEARRAAEAYLRAGGAAAKKPRRRVWMWGRVLGLAGAAAAGIAWITLHFIGV